MAEAKNLERMVENGGDSVLRRALHGVKGQMGQKFDDIQYEGSEVGLFDINIDVPCAISPI